MPRTSESVLSKLLRLIDDLTPEQVQIAKDILAHVERKQKGETAPNKRGRKPRTPASETTE